MFTKRNSHMSKVETSDKTDVATASPAHGGCGIPPKTGLTYALYFAINLEDSHSTMMLTSIRSADGTVATFLQFDC